MMSAPAIRMCAVLALLAVLPPGTSRAAGIGWPEAVNRLAGERSRAEACVALLKGYGSDEQRARGQITYAEAKANFDGVIAGLITALAEGGKPEGLPGLDAKLEQGASGLGRFCSGVSNLVPPDSGRKGFATDIATAAIEPLVKALSEGVAALYNNYRNDNAATRQTIQTELEAARWPDFGTVAATR